MNICRVVGSVVCPVQNRHLDRHKLLVCQPLDLALEPKGASFVAIDRVQAGEGDLVLTNKEGGGARIVLRDEATPVQQMVVAIVDDLHVDRSHRVDPPVQRLASPRAGGRG